MHFPFNWHPTEDGREGERGQTLVEYGLILSLVSIALIGTLIALKGSVEGVYEGIITAVEAAI